MDLLEQPSAHLLLQVDPGRGPAAAEYLASQPAFAEVVLISGAYDVIASVQGARLSQALAAAQRTPGLCTLRVCRAGAGASA